MQNKAQKHETAPTGPAEAKGTQRAKQTLPLYKHIPETNRNSTTLPPPYPGPKAF